MLLDLGTTDIQKFITENPASRHPPEQTWGENKFVRVAVSQPFPIPPFEEWIARSFVIGDFGSGTFEDLDMVAPLPPPAETGLLLLFQSPVYQQTS